MSALAVLAVVGLVWFGLSVLLALAVGKGIRLRDLREPWPQRTRTRVWRRAGSGGRRSTPAARTATHTPTERSDTSVG